MHANKWSESYLSHVFFRQSCRVQFDDLWLLVSELNNATTTTSSSIRPTKDDYCKHVYAVAVYIHIWVPNYQTMEKKLLPNWHGEIDFHLLSTKYTRYNPVHQQQIETKGNKMPNPPPLICQN